MFRALPVVVFEGYRWPLVRSRLPRARRALDVPRRPGAPVNIDAYCRWLARFFYAHGYDAEDLFQEARLAAWLAPRGLERVAARRRVLDVMRSARRRPLLVAPVELEAPDNVDDGVVARERLRAVIAAARPGNERAALVRVLRDEPITRHEKVLQVALWRLRRQARRRLEDLEPVAGDEVELERVIVSTGPGA